MSEREHLFTMIASGSDWEFPRLLLYLDIIEQDDENPGPNARDIEASEDWLQRQLPERE